MESPNQDKVKRLLSNAESRDCMPKFDSQSNANAKNEKTAQLLPRVEERKSLEFAKVEPPSIEIERPRSHLSLALSTRSDHGLTAVGDGFDRVSAYAHDTFSTIVFFPCFPHQPEMVPFTKVEIKKTANAHDLVTAAKTQYLLDIKNLARANNKSEPTMEETFPNLFNWRLWAAEDDGEIDDDVPVFQPHAKVNNKGVESFAIEKVKKKTSKTLAHENANSHAFHEPSDDDEYYEKEKACPCCSVS